ncbi:MAG: sensor histidine kinase [Deltaproteobacteria bacterium]|nr:MAG: sensor histidine kinase [Deltaproteobacteria bacterium]
MAAEKDAFADLRLTPRLRSATLILLGLVPLFLLLDLRYQSARRPALAVFYGVHAALSGAALLATFTATGRRRPDHVALLLILGLATNINVFFHRVPANPALISDVLTLLMMSSAFFFSWSALRQVIVCLVTCGGFALAGMMAPHEAAPFGYAFGVLVLGAVVTTTGSRVLGRYREGLARRQTELAELSTRLMSVQEEERHRLSRDLHEDIGQSLAAVSAYLQAIEQQLPPGLGELRARAADARRLAAKTVAQLRQVPQLLRPSVLDDYGLMPSLQTYLKDFQERHGVAATLSSEGVPERLPPPIETAIYRVVQEALSNVARHARARHVRVALATERGELRLRVDDDGVGLPPDGRYPGTGLVGIRERVQALGGSLTVASRAGTSLVVRLPIRGERAA